MLLICKEKKVCVSPCSTLAKWVCGRVKTEPRKKKKNKTDKKINKGKIKKPYRERYQRTFKIHKLIVRPLPS